jgi:hypothetical protein
MLENPEILPQIVHAADANSTEYTSPEDVDHLCGRTKAYAEKWAPKAQELWLEEHPTGKKIYADSMSMAPVEEKAKVIANEESDADKAYVSSAD